MTFSHTGLNGVLSAVNALDPHSLLTTNTGILSATGGTTTTLVDADFLADGFRGKVYVGGFVTLCARSGGQRHRRVSTDAPSTGTLTWTNALDSAVTTDDTYLVWTLFDPRQVEVAVGRALERMRGVVRVDITGIAGQRQYSLATDLDWVQSPEDVIAVSLRQGAVGQYVYRPLPPEYWRITEDRASAPGGEGIEYALELLGPTYTSADTLSVEAWKPYALWNTAYGYQADGDDTTAAPFNWLVAETLVDVLGAMTRAEWGPEAGLLERRLAQARAEAHRWRRRQRTHRPRPLFGGTTYGTWASATGSVW